MSDDRLILVDEHDTPIGADSRAACHAGTGRLHRAFSIYLFDRRGRLLLQKRSAAKLLWPQHWSNSCCSHPRVGETTDQAARRRLVEELGLETALQALFKFHYQARFGAVGSEHELCTVYVGAADGVGRVDPAEVEDWRFLDAAALDRGIAAQPATYTPWLRIAWARLRADHWPQVEAIFAAGPNL